MLQEYFKEFGYEGLEKTILKEYPDKESLAAAEKELICEKIESLKENCLNLYKTGSGSWDRVNSKVLSKEELEKRAIRCRNAGLAKRNSSEAIRARWSKNMKNSYASSSKEWFEEKYSKVSNSLKRYSNSEVGKIELSKRKIKNKETNIAVSRAWRTEFFNLFGRTPESFRYIGKMQEALNVFKSIKSKSNEEKENEIKRFMATVG